MRNLFISFICLLGLATSAISQAPGTQQKVNPQDTLGIFTTFSATGSSSALTVSTFDKTAKPGGSPGTIAIYAPKFITIQAFVTGTPGACSYHVWGTLKTPLETPTFPTDYQDLSGALDCTTAAGDMVHVYYKPVISVVAQLSTLTGGTSPTVQVRVLATH